MQRWLQRSCIALAVVLFAVSSARRAGANCGGGADYDVSPTGNTVTVCLQATSSTYACGQSGGLLRQNVETGEILHLANYCPAGAMGATSGGHPCYVDECVPAGVYRYGLSTPYNCSQAGCGQVVLFRAAVVAAPLAVNCQRSGGNSAPASTPQVPPWGSSAGLGAGVSNTKDCPGCGCRSSADAGVLSADAALSLVGAALWLRARRRGVSRKA